MSACKRKNVNTQESLTCLPKCLTRLAPKHCTARKIISLGVCHDENPRFTAVNNAVFYPCLSGILCAGGCGGMGHEFQPSRCVLGVISEMLCPRGLLVKTVLPFVFTEQNKISPLCTDCFSSNIYVWFVCSSISRLLPLNTTSEIRI